MSAGKENILSLVDKIRSSRDEDLKELNLLLNLNPSILYESFIEKGIQLSIYHMIALDGNLEAIEILNEVNAHEAALKRSLPPPEAVKKLKAVHSPEADNAHEAALKRSLPPPEAVKKLKAVHIPEAVNADEAALNRSLPPPEAVNKPKAVNEHEAVPKRSLPPPEALNNPKAVHTSEAVNAHEAVPKRPLPQIDMQAVNGETALMLAAFGGRAKNVKWLLSRNASVYLKSRLGSPIMHAIWGGSFRSFKEILDRTLDLNFRKTNVSGYPPRPLTFYETLRIPDDNGDTLLHHITKISGSRPKNDPSGALMARYMFQISGSDMLKLYNRKGNSPMMYALRSMNYPLMQLFLAKKEFTTLRPNERAQIPNADDVQNIFEDLRMADDFLEGYGRD